MNIKVDDKKTETQINQSIGKFAFLIHREIIDRVPRRFRNRIVVNEKGGDWVVGTNDKIFIWWEKGCFFGDTSVNIITKRGIKKLRDVRVGDYVLTHKNRWRKVTEKLKYPINEIIPRYTIITKTGKRVTVTEEHPFWTKRGWVKARDLKLTDEVMEIE